MQAIFGARNAATINLVIELVILAGLYLGFYYARKKRFRPHHANVQTTLVLLNLVLIVSIMVPAFYNFVILGGTTTGIVGTLMIVHAVLGAIAEGVALYLIAGERTQIIPKQYRVKNIKSVMRATLALWTIVVILGIGIYYFRYFAPGSAAEPSPTQVQSGTITLSMKDFQFAPKVITVKQGSTVVFVNQDDAKHTATGDNDEFTTGEIDAGKTGSITLDQVGTFAYFCVFHGDKGGVDMSGTITVEP